MKELAVSALALCMWASAASASIFYANTASTLVQIDTTAQTVTTIGTMQAGPNAMTVMADCDFNGSGVLTAIRQGNDSSGFPPPPLNHVYSVNTTTAAVLLQNNFGNTKQLNGLAWSSTLNKFLTVSQSDGILAALDVAAGTVTPQYAVKHGLGGENRIDALAFAPNGDLYGIWNGGPPLTGVIQHKLIRYNLATGTATALGFIGTTAQRFWSLRFDEAGTAYTVDAFSGTLYTVDLNTGAGTSVFTNAALNGTTGLALQIPAPGAAALLGAFGLAVARRRR